jgi:hypothetical protein
MFRGSGGVNSVNTTDSTDLFVKLHDAVLVTNAIAMASGHPAFPFIVALQSLPSFRYQVGMAVGISQVEGHSAFGSQPSVATPHSAPLPASGNYTDDCKSTLLEQFDVASTIDAASDAGGHNSLSWYDTKDSGEYKRDAAANTHDGVTRVAHIHLLELAERYEHEAGPNDIGFSSVQPAHDGDDKHDNISCGGAVTSVVVFSEHTQYDCKLHNEDSKSCHNNAFHSSGDDKHDTISGGDAVTSVVVVSEHTHITIAIFTTKIRYLASTVVFIAIQVLIAGCWTSMATLTMAP